MAEPGDDDIFDPQDAHDLDDFLQGLDADHVGVYRQKPYSHRGFCQSIQLAPGEPFDLNALANTWGGGEYRLRPMKKGKFAPGAKTVVIQGNPRVPERSTAAATSMGAVPQPVHLNIPKSNDPAVNVLSQMVTQLMQERQGVQHTDPAQQLASYAKSMADVQALMNPDDDDDDQGSPATMDPNMLMMMMMMNQQQGPMGGMGAGGGGGMNPMMMLPMLMQQGGGPGGGGMGSMLPMLMMMMNNGGGGGMPGMPGMPMQPMQPMQGMPMQQPMQQPGMTPQQLMMMQMMQQQMQQQQRPQQPAQPQMTPQQLAQFQAWQQQQQQPQQPPQAAPPQAAPSNPFQVVDDVVETEVVEADETPDPFADGGQGDGDRYAM